MSRVECPGAFSKLSVNVACLVEQLGLAHDGDGGLDEILTESSGLAHKAGNDAHVVLTKHGWYGVPFC